MPNLVKSGLLIGFIFLLLFYANPTDPAQLSFPLVIALDAAGPADNPYHFQLQSPVEQTVFYQLSSLGRKRTPTIRSSVGYGIWQNLQALSARDKNQLSTNLVHVLLLQDRLMASGHELDYFYRSPQGYSGAQIAVVEGQAKDLLELSLSPTQEIDHYLRGLLQHGPQRGFFPTCTMQNFRINQFEGKNPITPLLKMDDGRPKISGTAIFKRSLMVRKIDLDQSRNLVLLRGQAAQGMLPFQVDFDTYGVVRAENSRKVKVSYEEGVYSFHIQVFLKGRLLEIVHPPETSLTLADIEKNLASGLQEELESFVLWMQEDLKVDCIDINRFALAKWRPVLRDIIYEESFLENARIQVEVQLALHNSGELGP
jgi:Ger(x)C family germination protein